MPTTALIAALLLQAAPHAVASAPQTPPPATEGGKVVAYPASFFAAFRPETALDMLNRLPGFTLDQGGGQRGFAGGEGNVRLDGQLPASRGDNMQAILRRMPASSVERIDLIIGGAAGVDMQGQSVIANIVRKADSGVQVTAMTGVTFYEDRDLAPTARLELQRSQNGRVLEGLALYNDEPFGSVGTRVRGPAGAPFVSALDNPVLNENARVSGAFETPFAGGRTRVNATIGQTDNMGSVIDTPVGTALPSREDFRQIIQLMEAGGRYTRNLTGGVSLESSYFHQYMRRDLESHFVQGATDQVFASKNRQSEDILRGVIKWPKRGAWAFDLGAEGVYNQLDTASDLTLNGAKTAVPNSTTQVSELRGEAFGGAVWTMNPKFNVQFGLRLEGSTINTEGSAELEKTLNYIKPRVIATWTPKAGHMVVLRAERTVDQLSFADFSASASLTNATIVSGNPDLVPAENLILEARYEYRFLGSGSLVVGYSHTDTDNVVGRTLFPTPSGVIEAADNIGSGTRDLIWARFATPLDRIGVRGGRIQLSGIRRSSEILDPTTKTLRRFSNETPWEVSVNFSQDIPNSKWRWGIDAFTVDDLVTYLPREITVSETAYNLAAWFEYRPAPDVSFRVDGFNITDRENTNIRDRYAPDRASGPVVFTDARDLRGLQGGRGLRGTLRKSF